MSDERGSNTVRGKTGTVMYIRFSGSLKECLDHDSHEIEPISHCDAHFFDSGGLVLVKERSPSLMWIYPRRLLSSFGSYLYQILY